nr:TIGR04255 family protein [Prescottella equi]
MPANPLYENAPIALVLLEVRHPEAEVPTGATLAALKHALGATHPVQRTEQGIELNLQTGERTPVVAHKLIARDLHSAISFREDAMVIETTDYRGWDWFRGIAKDLLVARQDITPVDGFERIGLRYIDEVRVPSSSPVDWSEWVSASLLGPNEALASLGLRSEQQQGVVQYTTEDPGVSFTLRYGASRGSVIRSAPNLVRPIEPSDTEEFFLIDTDGAWSDPKGAVPEFDLGTVLETCDRLHAPIRELFEMLITEKLRSEVLRNAG